MCVAVCVYVCVHMHGCACTVRHVWEAIICVHTLYIHVYVFTSVYKLCYVHALCCIICTHESMPRRVPGVCVCISECAYVCVRSRIHAMYGRETGTCSPLLQDAICEESHL